MSEQEITRLEKRKDAAIYQRKITTCLGTRIEYDNEIEIIDRKLEQLNYKMKKTKEN